MVLQIGVSHSLSFPFQIIYSLQHLLFRSGQQGRFWHGATLVKSISAILLVSSKLSFKLAFSKDFALLGLMYDLLSLF